MGPDRLPEPLGVALAVARELEHVNISYVAVGSLATSVHGEPRSTDDLDFLVDLSVSAAERLVAALQPTYYVSRDAAIAAARQPRDGTFNAIHLATALKVDFFVVGGNEFDRSRLSARQRVGVAEGSTGELWVDTAEHTIARKLEWYRRGGSVSDPQWRDVLGVLRAQAGRLDAARLTVAAEQLGVKDLLDQARREAMSG